MIEKFRCYLCGKTFSSGFGLADHFRSKEHRDKAAGKNLDSLIEKFIGGVKTAINPSKVEEEQK